MRTARVYTEPRDYAQGKLRRSGFTLIELLVVIAIITILASIGLTIYSNAQKTARISKRVQDLKAIEAALEIYYNANNTYPLATSTRSECAAGGGITTGGLVPNLVITGLVPNYMAVFPSDPRMDTAARTSCYIYISDGVDYKIYDTFVSEMTSADFQNQRNLVDPRRDGGPGDSGPGPTLCDNNPIGTITAWAIYTTGARCW